MQQTAQESPDGGFGFQKQRLLVLLMFLLADRGGGRKFLGLNLAQFRVEAAETRCLTNT